MNGTFVVYASGSARNSVSLAVHRTAKDLGMDVRVVKVRRKDVPMYVYYQCGSEEAVPIFWEGSEEPLGVDDVCAKLRGMMFVLSFHPRHSALRGLRGAIMRFS